MKKVSVGEYLHHEIDKNAFFQVLSVNGVKVVIKKIDNLQGAPSLSYEVHIKDLKRNYIY